LGRSRTSSYLGCARSHAGNLSTEATKLNFKACPTEGYSEVLRIEMLDYALTYITRIHRSDDELRAMEGTPEASTSGPSAPPITLGLE
jgi:hypothetical protein